MYNVHVHVYASVHCTCMCTCAYMYTYASLVYKWFTSVGEGNPLFCDECNTKSVYCTRTPCHARFFAFFFNIVQGGQSLMLLCICTMYMWAKVSGIVFCKNDNH